MEQVAAKGVSGMAFEESYGLPHGPGSQGGVVRYVDDTGLVVLRHRVPVLAGRLHQVVDGPRRVRDPGVPIGLHARPVAREKALGLERFPVLGQVMTKYIVAAPIALPVFAAGVPLAVVVHLVSVIRECLVRGSQLLQPRPTAAGLAIAKV